MKTLFLNDYSEGAHPQILEALVRTNFQQELGYSCDSFVQEAAVLIKKIINKPEAALHFVSTGTQANLIAIASMLQPYESIIAAETGHIAVHETGAIEATGHKVHLLPTTTGKLAPEAILKLIEQHKDEHMVKPRAVYLSQSTELGTLYSKAELQNIYELCQKKGVSVFIDGARLGSALMAEAADFTFEDIASCSDIFTIGGTKNGALLGEVLVIVNPKLQENFRYHLKQRGALMAKGRTLGVQFIELFKKNLYFENAKYANAMAKRLSIGIREAGYEFFYEPVTNQIFPIFPEALIERLQQKFGFYIWCEVPNKPGFSVVRLVTSWATQEADLESFLRELH